MPAQLYQYITLSFNIAVFICAIYYILFLRTKAKEIKEKEKKVEMKYEEIINDALQKEKKILDETTSESSQLIKQATSEADQIIASANQVSNDSKHAVDQALSQMSSDVQKNAVSHAQEVLNSYSANLKQIATTSLTNFQNVTKSLQDDMQKQSKAFKDAQLPALERELTLYKEMRMKETEQMIGRIVQKASQEIFNKSISLEDHQKMILESLEKAKREGVFD